jgi:hypothetical protein
LSLEEWESQLAPLTDRQLDSVLSIQNNIQSRQTSIRLRPNSSNHPALKRSQNLSLVNPSTVDSLPPSRPPSRLGLQNTPNLSKTGLDLAIKIPISTENQFSDWFNVVQASIEIVMIYWSNFITVELSLQRWKPIKNLSKMEPKVYRKRAKS